MNVPTRQVAVLCIFIFGVIAGRFARCDVIECLPEEIQTEDIGNLGQMTVKKESCCRFAMGDYYELRLNVLWKTTNGKSGSATIYEGMSTGCPQVHIEGNELYFDMAGNRYDPEGYRTRFFYHWNADTQTFDEDRTEVKDPWADNMALLKDALRKGAFHSAHALTLRMGNSPNGGHTFANEEIAELFFNAVHRHATKLYKQGRKQQAADDAMVLLYDPPGALYGDCHDNMEEFLNWSPWRQSLCVIVSTTPAHIAMFNDLAFYILEYAKAQQSEAGYRTAREALSFIVAYAPDRPATLLNLADAQWLAQHPDAPTTYRKYLNVMPYIDTANRIPRRARDRAAPP